MLSPAGKKNGVPLVNEIAQWIHSFYSGSYSCLASFPGYPQILSRSRGKKSAPIFLHSCEIKSGSGLGTRVTLANCRQPSTQLLACVSASIHRHTVVGTPVRAAYSDVIANTTAVPCTIGVHTLTVLPGCCLSVSSFKLTLEVAI